MLRKAVVTLMLAGLVTVAGAETVYKWMDSGGQVHYTDRPPVDPGARVLAVYEEGLASDEEEDADSGATDDGGADFAEPGPGSAGDASPGDLGLPRPSAETVAAVQQDVEQVRAEQCQKARERYRTYVESQRLYRETPNGGRAYLSDAELAEARVRAKQAVDEYCN